MKVFLGIAAGYLVLLWALCAVVVVAKWRDGVHYSVGLAPVVLVLALFTVGAVALQRRAWRDGEGFGAAVLTSLVAGLTVTGLLFLLSLAGG